MRRLWLTLIPIALLIALGLYYLLRPTPAPPPVPVAAPAPLPAPQAPAVSHPLDVPPGVSELPPLAQADDFVRERLAELLGAGQLKQFVQLENFVRRVVATVDNLARPLAPPSKWPIQVMPGRFTVERHAEGSTPGAGNWKRYTPFVSMVAAVDSARAVALYRKLYPLFQSAYEELGYPGKYFNDRLVAVIDVLLQTPEPAQAPRVDLPEIHGPVKPTRPWVLYRYSDPALESLASGQKILLRVGPENAKRLKAKLAEIRALIARP